METLLSLFVILFLLIFVVAAIGVLVFFYIGLWKMYTKAGQAGWKCLIPYYNNWVLMVDICDMHFAYFIVVVGVAVLNLIFTLFSSVFSELGWDVASYVIQMLSWLVVIVSYAVNFATYYNLSKKFNKKTGWVILTFFFGFITIPLLGISKKEQFVDVEVSKHSLFGSIGK